MTLPVVCALAFVATFVALIWSLGQGADRRRANRFKDRENWPAKRLWEQSYRESGIPESVVEDALALIEQATGVPAGRLRPEDGFTEILAPEKGWEFDDGIAELRWELEARAKVRGSAVATVDEFIRVLAETRR